MSVTSVIVDDRHVRRTSRSPDEADAPLVVDADAVLSSTVPLEEFQAIARWNPKFVEFLNRIEHQQLCEHLPSQSRVDAFHAFAMKQPLGIPIGEGDDHSDSV